MKKFTLFLLFILNEYFELHAQCPASPVVLTTQAQVDAFPVNWPGCTYPTVRFEIGMQNGSSTITDLTPLSQLEGFGNHTYIHFNPNLTTLTGLENVTEVIGDFTVQANHSLTDLQGLNGLSYVEGLFKIENNNALQTLEGLTPGATITNVESLVIIENDALTDLSNVLDNLETVDEYVYINDNASLPTLNTMNNLISIGWYLNLENLPSLTAFNAFSSLQSVGLLGPATASDFEVINCPSLATLNDFVSLSELGRGFELSDNTSLTEMSFPSLITIGGEMTIGGNTSLTSLVGLGDFDLAGPLFIVTNTSLPECEAQGICNYLADAANTATISNNDPGCNNRNQVEAVCAALPVSLVYFTGNADNDEVQLSWQTNSEVDNDYFEVEHSTDGSLFKALDQIAGSGTSSVSNSYSYQHANPSSGDNYYRLKQVDFDGQFEYSNIVRVRLGNEDELHIYPNPTKGSVFVTGNPQNRVVSLTDFTGKVLLEKSHSESDLFDLNGQPSGIYFIEIQTGSKKVVKRVVKE